ncbi:MAG TPA: hypothetical protein VMM15_15820 [Bradyrhizobium sp.]|nr:hypothetical protein [Bradyrhizobium sp.]
MSKHPSRRTVLGLFAAVGAVLASGVYAFRTGPEALVGKILARQFPGVRIDAAGIAALTRDVKEARFQSFGRRLALEGGARAAGIVGLDTLAQWKWTAASFSQLERKVVTFFILGSNFLDVRDPKADLVSYVEAPLVCPNRFAEYD